MIPLVISYFTTNTPYEDESRVLIESLNAFDIPHEIIGVPSLGSWQRNTIFKSQFVRRKLDQYAGRPLVWIDVDAIVIQKPTLLSELDFDIAAARYGGAELLSGTVYFSGSEKCRETVDRWCGLCEQYPDKFPGGLLPHFPTGSEAWDQRLLDIAIRQTGARFFELPPAYTYIVGISQRKYRGQNPVILHTRGRLRFEKAVNHA